MIRLLGTGPPGDISEDTVVGEALEVGNRTVYPVLRVMAFRMNEGNFLWAWISPLALVVVELTQEYVVALTDEKFSSDRLLEMVISSKGGRRRPRGLGSKKSKKQFQS